MKMRLKKKKKWLMRENTYRRLNNVMGNTNTHIYTYQLLRLLFPIFHNFFAVPFRSLGENRSFLYQRDSIVWLPSNEPRTVIGETYALETSKMIYAVFKKITEKFESSSKR